MKHLGLESLLLPGGPATVLWRRNPQSRRVSLRIDAKKGHVVVTLPMRAGRAAGMALLHDNAAWVSEKLAALPTPVRLQAGASVTIDGVPHPIIPAPDARGGAWLENGALHVTGAPEFLARRVGDFLRAEARRRFSTQALAKAHAAGLTPKRVTVKDTRSRWGSCAANRNLAFSWRLVMAPRFVQDYVAAHEVAHLRHMNHGPRFWALVEQLTPHSAAAVEWLRTQGPRLLRVG